MKTIANVKELGEIVETYSDFYSELKELKQNKAEIITSRNEADARISTYGNENIGKEYGTWIAYGNEYIKGKLPILRANSRLLNLGLVKKAVEANRKGNYFSTNNNEFYEKSLKEANSEKNKDYAERNIILLPSKDNFTISQKENWNVAQFIFRDKAEEYFRFIRDKYNIDEITFYTVDKDVVDNQKGTLLTQLWLSGLLVLRSGLNGCLMGLDYDCSRAHGVRKISAEGASSQKILPKFYDVGQVVDEASRTSSFAPDQIKILRNILEQNNYQIIKSK